MNVFNAKSKWPYGSKHIASAEVLAARVGLLTSARTFLEFLSTATVSFPCSVSLGCSDSVSPSLACLLFTVCDRLAGEKHLGTTLPLLLQKLQGMLCSLSSRFSIAVISTNS